MRSSHDTQIFELISLLKQCTKSRDLAAGRKLHSEVISAGSHTNKYIASALINMYSKCSSVQDALGVFNAVRDRDVVMWTSLILAYADNGNCSQALELFTRMDCEPNYVTYVAALKACSGLASEQEPVGESCLHKGRELHERIKLCGFETNPVVANALLEMYSKCGDMVSAQDIFDEMKEPDVVSWNCLILGYVENGQSLRAMSLVPDVSCEPNSYTQVAALKTCATLAAELKSEREFCLERGTAIHKRIKEQREAPNVLVSSSLVEMYCKCGSMQSAQDVFDRMTHRNVVTWTSLILGYVENGNCSLAMEFFTAMDCQPDSFTFVAALKACAGLAAERESEKGSSLLKGMELHEQIKKRGFEPNVVVSTALVDMYMKCGSVAHARGVFEQMPHRDVITWNHLLSGYVEKGDHASAMDLYVSMDCKPNSFTFVPALKASTSLELFSAGKEVHALICQLGLEQDPIVGNSLVDFYGKRSDMDTAELVFSSMHCPSLVSWTALIAGYTRLGEKSRMSSLVTGILETGLQMDSITFVCILAACSHAGLVAEGKVYFGLMSRYGLSPSPEHYTCMVDVLGRVNRLEEALALVENMPVEADEITWTSLLAASSKWSNLRVGKVAFDSLVAGASSDDGLSAACVLMRDIYRKLGLPLHPTRNCSVDLKGPFLPARAVRGNRRKSLDTVEFICQLRARTKTPETLERLTVDVSLMVTG